MIYINKPKLNILDLNSDAKKAVVMIHGIFTNLSLFYFTIAQELAKKYRIILYDLRGHGLSDTPSSGYDLNSMHTDLLEILAARNLNKVHLIAYSYGGLIALYTALHRPELVDKLVIIETPNLDDGQKRPLLTGYSRRYLNKYLKGLSQSTKLAVNKRKMNDTHTLVHYLFEQTTLKKDLVSDKQLFTQVANANIVHETLLLYAKQGDCGRAGEFLHEHIALSTLLYGNGDHSIPVQNPNWILDNVVDFLAR